MIWIILTIIVPLACSCFNIWALYYTPFTIDSSGEIKPQDEIGVIVFSFLVTIYIVGWFIVYGFRKLLEERQSK